MYQELQLNAEFDRLELVTGVSYFQEDVYGSPGTGSPNYDRRGTSVFPAAANEQRRWRRHRAERVFVTVVTDGVQNSESIGVFANVTWHMTDRLNITPGIRYALDEKAVAETRFAANDFVPFGGAPSTSISAADDWDNTDWRLTLDYAITDNSHGLRHVIGIVSLRRLQLQHRCHVERRHANAAIVAGTSPAFTPPEQVRSDEIGGRTEWFDGRLRLNLTYFDMAYTDRQGAVNIADTTSPTGFRIELRNTGDVDLSGYELEGQIAATDNFLIDFSAGFLDSQILDVCANNGDFILPGPVEDSYSLGGRWTNELERGAS